MSFVKQTKLLSLVLIVVVVLLVINVLLGILGNLDVRSYNENAVVSKPGAIAPPMYTPSILNKLPI